MRRARLLKDSNLSQFLALQKCQTVEQYCKWDKMKALYNFNLVSDTNEVTKSNPDIQLIVDFFT